MASLKTTSLNTRFSQKTYLAKDFAGFRSDLLTYARNYFGEQIQDFNEASLGGMFLELAAYVGDSMSFYLDHQFNELDPGTAVESLNIQAHARNAGVKAIGAAPAVANVAFYIEVPASLSDSGEYLPLNSALPVIGAGTVLSSNSGIRFRLDSELDFGETDKYGTLYAAYVVGELADDGNPATFILNRTIECVSGETRVEYFTIPDNFIPFRKITLANPDVTQIIEVTDSDSDQYYEVESLTQDVVYKRIKNYGYDEDLVSESIQVTPAPKRFTARMDISSRLTTIEFGSGDATSLDDDILPDPSELALPLYGKRTLSRFSIDPSSLLQTKTLGTAPRNTTLTVTYRYGGGLNHNVASNSIRTVQSLVIDFPRSPTLAVSNAVITSLDARNNEEARGGASAMSLEDLRSQIFAARNQQSRIVTQEDLISRIYTLPSNFGRVFRASVAKSTDNPLASRLYLVAKNSAGELTHTSDTLKKNLSTYLNEFRLVSDAVDILDATVITYKVNFSIICTPNSNKNVVVSNVIVALRDRLDRKYYQIDQPVIEAELINTIINVSGVLSLVDLTLTNLTGNILDRTYSDFAVDMQKSKINGLYLGPQGSIFELKYPDFDIIGAAQ
jgi:hypothetical protein